MILISICFISFLFLFILSVCFFIFSLNFLLLEKVIFIEWELLNLNSSSIISLNTES